MKTNIQKKSVFCQGEVLFVLTEKNCNDIVMKYMKYPEVAKRFKQARLEIRPKLSQKMLGELVGMTQQGVQDIEAGKVKSPGQIQKFSEILKKPKEWLLFGTPTVDLVNREELIKKIPIISLQEVRKWDKIRSIYDRIPPEDFVIDTGKYGECCFAIRVEGDSMVSSITQKSFNPGEVIVVSPTKKPLPGKYVIYIEKGSKAGFFKQYVTDGDKKYLKPLNPQYPTILLTDDIKIVGVVIAHLDENL